MWLEEPPINHHPLLDVWKNREPWLGDRLILCPHSAFYSDEAICEIRAFAAEIVLTVLSGGKPYNVVNGVKIPSMGKIYYDEDADLKYLSDKTVGIIGYGIQGRAQAQNMRDLKINVMVANRADKYRDQAIEDGFKVYEIKRAS